jgi:hypothetical protein
MMPGMRKEGMMLQIPRPPLIPSHGTTRREWTEGVTFRRFRWLAVRCGWAVKELVECVGAGAFGGPRSSPYYEIPAGYLARACEDQPTGPQRA